MDTTLPVHRQLEDCLIDYHHAKRAFQRDGEIDHTEALALIELVEGRVFPQAGVVIETAEWTAAAWKSPAGIRGQRPQRLARTAARRAVEPLTSAAD